MFSRRRFLGSAACATAALRAPAIPLAGIGRPPAIATEKRPNILIFMPDQQTGATVLPGSASPHPRLEKFQQQAVTFSAAYCPAPHCCPSRASFMTGQYPSEHGIYNNVDTDSAIHTNPHPGTPFWSTSLREAGYTMLYSGKWHVARDLRPADVGWRVVSEAIRNQYVPGFERSPARWSGIGQAWRRDARDTTARRAPGELLRPGWGNYITYRTLADAGNTGYEESPDTAVVRAGIAAMQTAARADSPWCLMVSNTGSHDPYDAPRSFVERIRREARCTLPASYVDWMQDKPRVYQRQRLQGWSQMTQDEALACLEHYYARCAVQDALFGELLDALDATGQADNTLVLYTSDHGDYAGAHGLWMKGIPAFREAYHIPCVLRWPRRNRSAGSEVKALTSTVDFASTVLEAAGLQSPQPLSGASLLPWLDAGSPEGWRDAIFSQMNGVELYYTQRSTMTERYKYVYNGFDYDELYDLATDPGETRNLAFPGDSATQVQPPGRANGDAHTHAVPWPPLEPVLDTIRRNLLERMWTFAREHKDTIFNPYETVALAPYGPGVAF